MLLPWLALAWLAGIAAGQASTLTVGQWLVLALIALAGSVWLRGVRGYRLLFAVLFVLCLGAARFQAAARAQAPSALAALNDSGRSVALEGLVIEPPDLRDAFTLLRVQTQRLVTIESGIARAVEGLVLVEAPRTGGWAYGDRVRVVGRLETPSQSEASTYRDFLSRQGIYSTVRGGSVTLLERDRAGPLLLVVYGFRARALQSLMSNLPDPEASLLAGILLGAQGTIPPEVKEAFNRTGTSHIIAISGFNISLIAGALVSVFGRWLGARWGAVVAGVAILIYTLMVGASASVVRAALMGGLSLLALRLGRQTAGLASLGAAAVVMTAINPFTLWDAGFQLSFAATLGLVLYGGPLQDWARRRLERLTSKKVAARLSGPASEFLLFTLAAQLTTLPLTIYYFQRISLASLVANPVILPAQPGIMVLGGLSALAGAIWAPLGRPLAWLAWPFAAFTIRAVELFASLPGAAVTLGEARLLPIIGMYLVLFGATWLARLPEGRRPSFLEKLRGSTLSRLPVGAAALGLSILTGVVWSAAVDSPDDLLRLTVLDVGAGDAVLIEGPTGRHMLVDGGPSPVTLSDALGRRLSPLGDSLDWIVLTGSGDAQVAGLSGVIDRYPVGGVLTGGLPGSADYRRMLHLLEERGVPILAAEEGQTLDLGGGARLEVVAAGGRASAFLLTFGRLRVLLAPAAEEGLLSTLQEEGALAEATAALLPDAGSVEANPREWLMELRPWIALISVEAGNRRGLPSPETLAALVGSTVLRTDLNGWIELTSDGEQMWVEVERVPGD